MKRLLLAAASLFAIWSLTLIPSAKADGIDIYDPLHGMVCSAGSCTNAADNGSFTPLPGQDFGFTISPGPQTGTFTLVVGVPTDEINTGTFNLPGLTDNGGGLVTSPFSRVSFYNSGSTGLAAFIGLGSGFSPTDNFSNLSQGTLANDPGFGGNFLLFTVTVPSFTLDQTCQGCSLTNALDFASLLPGGSFVTGLFVYTDDKGNVQDVGTAASAHLVQLSAVPGPIAGAGIPGLVGACIAMVGLARSRFRRWRGNALA